MLQMKNYKRNQVEDGLARAFGAARADEGLQNRIKRLLLADRGKESKAHNKKSAFFSFATPGTGTEVQFSAYDAFAILLGLKMLDHGWPQGFVVEVLRKARKDLELAHSRQLQKPIAVLSSADSAKTARAGQLVTSVAKPCFLLAVFLEGRESTAFRIVVSEDESEVMALMREKPGQSISMFEISQPIHVLDAALKQTRRRARGRSASK